MLPPWFQTLPPVLLWRRSPKKMVIGRRSSVQSGILPWWMIWSCSPFHTLLIFIILQPPGPPFLPFLCLMFFLSIFVSFSFSQSSPVLLQCSNAPTFISTHSSTPPPSLWLFSLTISDGSLYSAMSSVAGHAGSIRRTFGSQKLLKTENVWLLSE